MVFFNISLYSKFEHFLDSISNNHTSVACNVQSPIYDDALNIALASIKAMPPNMRPNHIVVYTYGLPANATSADHAVILAVKTIDINPATAKVIR